MLPKLDKSLAISPLYEDFLKKLSKTQGFTGEISNKLSYRLLASTDNSIYQVVPQAVISPKSQQDIVSIFELSQQKQYQSIQFAPRGGGTGTNAQSLNHGIIIDCSKFLNRIININLTEHWVEVEPGVVLDQLNDYLKPFGKFFAPNLSPSSRATIGGMVNTDASGKGSKLYGKTSEHILQLTCVFVDGSVQTIEKMPYKSLKQQIFNSDIVQKLYECVYDIHQNYQQQMHEHIPKLTRFVTGYNIEKAFDKENQILNLGAMIAGSEGTLAYVSKIKLKLTDLPKAKVVFVVLYPTFNDALEHAKTLVDLKPEAIETLDETVLSLAKTDIIYDKVKSFLQPKNIKTFASINLIEFVADSEEQLKVYAQNCETILSDHDSYKVEQDSDIQNLWQLRKKSVGLLGKTKGLKKPVSGVEDTVVPPEKLCEFVKEFRAILDARNLKYGMFGHIDVGCLHVRPAFDLLQDSEREAYFEVIDEVAALTRKYGGVLWGEHGKGFRSSYTKEVFGEELYRKLREIKSICDPLNQLNPGKIATPLGSNSELIPVNNDFLRATFDTMISKDLRKEFSQPLNCNGNGACFGYSVKDVMCPSYKITRNRIHSPKGRASLLREWLRQKSQSTPEVAKSNGFVLLKNSWYKKQNADDFSHEVYEAMDGCLGCQACKSQCPVNINVPDFKAKFLHAYHSRYLRPLSDYLIAYSEKLGYYQSHFPRINNLILKQKLIKLLLKHLLGFVDPPLFSRTSLNQSLRKNNIGYLDVYNSEPNKNSVVFVQDWVTSFYEAPLVLKTCLLYRKLGYHVLVLPWIENGKTYHAKGMLKPFFKLVNKNMKLLNQIAKMGLPMVGLDPSMVLTYRFEYPDVVDLPSDYDILLPQEFLVAQNLSLELNNSKQQKKYILLNHCTEQANLNQAASQWVELFAKFNLSLQPMKVGCCGMAGSYGHEVKHYDDACGLFELSWREIFESCDKDTEVLVTGFSCRAQVARIIGKRPKHPLEVLYENFRYTNHIKTDD